MATKIRLQRHGRKGAPIFKIVVADSRAKRDGKYIQKLGQYNPNTNPATIDINFDIAVDWLMKGAQPTDTVRAMLSYKGIMMKKHLLSGVAKGAFSEEEAEKRFEAWLAEKENKVDAQRDVIVKAAKSAAAEKLAAEKAVSDARAAELAVANSELVAEATEEVAEEATEAVAEEATTEETPVEAAAEETAEVAPAEAVEEAPVEAATETIEETTVEEAKEEKVEATAEVVAEEAPAAEKEEPKAEEAAE
jgi:small subunit ribosomal protein S16